MIPFALLAALIFALIAGASILFHKKKTVVPKPGQLAVLDDDLLRTTLIRRGVPAKRMVQPFSIDENVRKLVGGAKNAKRGIPRAQAIAEALAKKLAGVRMRVSDVGKAEVRSAPKLAKALLENKVKVAISYEVSALLMTMLRSAELSALLCEVHELDAPMRSADATGTLGRYAVAVYKEDALGRKPLVIFDPLRAGKVPAWAGGGGDLKMASKATKIYPLDDGSAAAHFLMLQAATLIRRAPEDSPDAYEMSKLALKAASPSASLHVARARVLLASGGVADALNEATKALGIRKDAPRRTAVAQLMVANKRAGDARTHLEAAIKADPTFWPAQAMLASLHWAMGKKEDGKKHFEAAKKLAPDAAAVVALEASRKLADGELEEGIALLRKAAAKEDSMALRFKLYLALMQIGKKDEAKKLRQQLEKSASKNPALKRALKAVDQAATRAATPQPPPLPKDPAKLDQPPPMPKIPSLKLPDVKFGK